MAAAARSAASAAGVKDWASRFVAITDKHAAASSPRAQRRILRDVFIKPVRYQAALFRVDALRASSLPRSSACRCRAARSRAPHSRSVPHQRLRANPGVALGALLGAAARAGRDKLTLLPARVSSTLGWIQSG